MNWKIKIVKWLECMRKKPRKMEKKRKHWQRNCEKQKLIKHKPIKWYNYKQKVSILNINNVVNWKPSRKKDSTLEEWKLYKLSKLTLDYFEKLNKPVTLKESELGVKSIPSLTKDL